jgi:hypothetical protein
MRARLGGFAAVVVVAVGCGSGAGYAHDAGPDTNSACAVRNASAEAVALCGVPPVGSECCGLVACPPFDEVCAGSYPYGCCSCSGQLWPQPVWLKPDFDCWRDGGWPADAGDCTGLPAPTVLVWGQANNTSTPRDIAVDDTSVYWFDHANYTGQIIQVPLTGGTPTTLATTDGEPARMAVSSAGVFWTAFGTGVIWTIPLTGGSPVPLASVPGAYAITADATTVYWTTWYQQDSSEIGKVAATGGSPITLASGLMRAFTITVDSNAVYWTDADTDSILSVPLAGGTPVILVSQQHATLLVSDGVSLYWTNSEPGLGSGAVMKMPVAGGTPVTLADKQDRPTAIAVDGTNVYWTTTNGEGRGAIMSVPIAGGTPVSIACNQGGPERLTVDATRLYWTNGGWTSSGGSVMAIDKQRPRPADAGPDASSADGPADAGTD